MSRIQDLQQKAWIDGTFTRRMDDMRQKKANVTLAKIQSLLLSCKSVLTGRVQVWSVNNKHMFAASGSAFCGFVWVQVLVLKYWMGLVQIQ